MGAIEHSRRQTRVGQIDQPVTRPVAIVTSLGPRESGGKGGREIRRSTKFDGLAGDCVGKPMEGVGIRASHKIANLGILSPSARPRGDGL